MRVVVAIPTFRRPERLAELLPAVGEHLSVAQARGLIEAGEILVVDNDVGASARSVAQGSYAGFTPIYVVEATPGIPAVRNRAIDECGGARLLAFIDDDERPRTDWLVALLETWNRFGQPTAVMGRVVSIFADDVDPWVSVSGLFERPRMETGTEIAVAATGNLLLDLAQVRRAGVRFDESIGLGGGSDTLFSTMLKRAGGRIVWCDESVAEDVVEPERQTRRWALKRAYSHGSVVVLVRIRTAGGWVERATARMKGVWGGSARLMVGALRAAFGVAVRSKRHQARGERMLCRGAGMIAGSAGRTYAAYGRSPVQATAS